MRSFPENRNFGKLKSNLKFNKGLPSIKSYQPFKVRFVDTEG